MAQVTLYLPDELADRIRREARKARKSVSAYMAELAMRRLAPGGWPKGFSDLYGSFRGELAPVDDPPPEEDETERLR